MEAIDYQTKDLQSLLKCLNAKSTEKEIKNVFSEIANKLFSNYHIVKGDNTYDFLEIEFYFYSPSHKDLITYPRKSNKPGMWFFHMSGVDITFGSNEKEDNHTLMYGGVLIRSLIKTSKDKESICGPMKCVDELFDYIHAFDGNINREDIPYLKQKEERETISVESCCRYIPILFLKEKDRRQKIQSKFEELKKRRTEKDWKEFPKLKEDWDNHDYSVKEFEEFLNRPYRFYRNNYNEWTIGYNAKPLQKYYYPFGETLHPLVQQDRTPKKVFVLGVYASAVHARWKQDNKIICQAIAVASEPRIFWDGNPEEAAEIISRIRIPQELGTLEPAGSHLNGPSAKVLDEHILAPLGYTRKDAWLCDLLPETRINSSQAKVIEEKYNPLIEKYGLNPVTIPDRPTAFCDSKRCEEILAELKESQAELLVLLGDIPIKQFLSRVAHIDYSSLQEYVNLFGYGNKSKVIINGQTINVLPLAHPRQIGALGSHSEKWNLAHIDWEKKQ